MATPEDQQLTPEGGWSNPGRVRLGPMKREEQSLRIRLFAKVIGKVGRLQAFNVFLLLMRNFRLFRGWLNYSSKMMPYGTIGRRNTELAILRVAWVCRSRYEWGQHVDIGLRAGLKPEEIARVPLGSEAADWTDKQRQILNCCDEFCRERMISDATWDALGQHFNDKQLIELFCLINHYQGLANMLNSTGLPLDAAVEEILANAPIHKA